MTINNMSDFPSVPEISVDQLKQAIDAKEDFMLLDVRSYEEFSKKRIAGCIHVPVDEIAQKIQHVIPDKHKTIYVYCLSGGRSAEAVHTMIQLGYSNVFSVASGLLAWRPKGYPLEQ
jgi:rhodanese-related sulfurtransferase